MLPRIFPQVVNVDNHEVPQEQPRQDSVLVTVEAPNKTKPEYRGHPIHVQISQVA